MSLVQTTAAGHRVASIVAEATHAADIASLSYGSLTPDMLIAYVAEKLGGIDTKVQQMMEKQHTREKQSEALSTLANALGRHQADIPEGAAGDAARTEIDSAYANAIDAVGSESPLATKLAAERTEFDRTAQLNGVKGDTSNRIDAKEMDGFLTNLNRIQSDLNQGGELDMMQLQSFMSQRQQVIQMGTNIVGSLGDTTKAIAQKIGG